MFFAARSNVEVPFLRSEVVDHGLNLVVVNARFLITSDVCNGLRKVPLVLFDTCNIAGFKQNMLLMCFSINTMYVEVGKVLEGKWNRRGGVEGVIDGAGPGWRSMPWVCKVYVGGMSWWVKVPALVSWLTGRVRWRKQ